MKNTYTILNRIWLAYVFGVVAFIILLITFFITDRPMWGWISLACSLLFILSALITPAVYRVDKDGISIYYPPFAREHYLWKKVDSVCMDYDLAIPYVFDYIFILGEQDDAPAFFKEGKIPYSKRATRIIEECSRKKILGAIPDSVKGMGQRYRAKLEYHSAPVIDEAQAGEREARRIVREAVKNSPIPLEVEYSYITFDGQRRARPNIDYTYSVCICDSESGKIIYSASLLSVKLKKNVLRREPIDKETLTEGIKKALADNQGN